MRQSGAETLVTEEPYALIAHVRVCGGAGWVTIGSTRKKAKVMLYEHAAHLLAPFAPKLQTYAQRALQERGVEVHTGTGVRKIGPTSIDVSTGDTVKTHTLVWAAGLQANPIVNALGIDLVHGSRIPVGADLQVQDHPGVFAIGDIAAMLDGKTGQVLPGSAPPPCRRDVTSGQRFNAWWTASNPSRSRLSTRASWRR